MGRERVDGPWIASRPVALFLVDLICNDQLSTLHQ